MHLLIGLLFAEAVIHRTSKRGPQIPDSRLLWAVIFIPIPLPIQVLQTSYCTHLLFKDVLQTGLGMGMGMNGTAHSLIVFKARGSGPVVPDWTVHGWPHAPPTHLKGWYSVLRVHGTRQKDIRFAWSHAIFFWAAAFRVPRRVCRHILKPCKHNHLFSCFLFVFCCFIFG